MKCEQPVCIQREWGSVDWACNKYDVCKLSFNARGEVISGRQGDQRPFTVRLDIDRPAEGAGG